MKVGIGPQNTAGQAYRLAVALRGAGIDAESWTPTHHRMGFPVDRVGGMRKTYTHVIAWTGQRVDHRRVADAFQGSELRDPYVHARLERWSPFHDPEVARGIMRNHRLPRPGVPTFVATLEMLDYVPAAGWIPIIAEPAPIGPLLRRPRPVVLFNPTHGTMKGARYVDALDVPEVDLRRPGPLSPAEMLRAIGEADVVIGGLVLGDYGGTEIQALAAGRVVVGNVGARVRSRMSVPVPIVQAEPDTLADVLRDIARRRDAYRELAAAGPPFWAEYHDGRRSVAALSEFLGLAAVAA